MCLEHVVCQSGSWSPGFTPPPTKGLREDDSDSWCVITRYTRVYHYPEIPGVRDPRLLKKRLLGYKKLTVRKKLLLVDESFDFKKIKHIDSLEKRDLGIRDWSEYL